jgi:hypothetical protein
MPRLLRRALLGAAPLLLSTPALAQTAPPPSDSPDIVVTGQKDADRQIRDFVGALTRTMDDQITRFEWAVCPAVLGLPPQAREAVVSRMRAVAEAAGMRVDKPGCLPNVLVMVTHDKRAFLETLNRKYPDFFGTLSFITVHRLEHTPGPAVAWQLRGPPISSRGVELAQDQDTQYSVNRTTEMPSRITASARSQFAASALVVEASALAGLTTMQLADYAAMRTYAQTDPAHLPPSSPPTILKVLDAAPDGQVPLSLTQWDLSFLKALYASSPNLYAHGQRSEMRGRVEKELKRPEEKRGK